MPRVFSSPNNPVRWDPSEERDSFTVYGLEHIRGALKGLGLLYFYMTGSKTPVLRSEFVLLQSTPAEYSMIQPQVTMASIDAQAKGPASGIITESRDGTFIIAPSLKLDVPEGRDLALMLVSPIRGIHEVSTDKMTLEVPSDEATVTLSTGSGELRCSGSVSGKGVKGARLVLNRNPRLPVFSLGFDEKLCELNGPGEISAVWKPISRNFEECLLVFHPGQTDYSSFENAAEHLGAPEDDFTGTMENYVVGDGVGVNYAIRLTLDRSLGRHSSDEARLTLT
jgi:hypothetical protein